MSFAVVSYAISIGAVALYLGQLARERRRLERQLGTSPGEPISHDGGQFRD